FGKIVMFGVLDLALLKKYFDTFDFSLLTSMLSNETWTYDLATNTWTRMSPRISPPARNSHALAYDRQNDVVILFGGGDMFTDFDDTWAYDIHHDTWTEIPTSRRPSAR